MMNDNLYQWSQCRPICDEHKKIEYILNKLDITIDNLNKAVDHIAEHQQEEDMRQEAKSWIQDNISTISVGTIVGILCLFIGHLI